MNWSLEEVKTLLSRWQRDSPSLFVALSSRDIKFTSVGKLVHFSDLGMYISSGEHDEIFISFRESDFEYSEVSTANITSEVRRSVEETFVSLLRVTVRSGQSVVIAELWSA